MKTEWAFYICKYTKRTILKSKTDKDWNRILLKGLRGGHEVDT